MWNRGPNHSYEHYVLWVLWACVFQWEFGGLKINVSFSAGESSGYMCHLLLNHPKFEGNDYVFMFANTGSEHHKTLEFAHKCDEHFGLDLVWLEAKVYHGERRASGFTVTDYKTASRKNEPFEQVIKKYGIPNVSYKHCNRELKLNPIETYQEHVGRGDCQRAIGMRADEPRRIKQWLYPLNELGVDKQDVNNFWEGQPFRLEIEPHQGNCTWCIEKSVPKLAKVFSETPETFDFPRRMEELYSDVGRKPGKPARRLFRGNMNVEGIEILSKDVSPLLFNMDEDESGGCSESCEAL